jgi:hypothetical protein
MDGSVGVEIQPVSLPDDTRIQNTADLLHEMSAYASDEGVMLASEDSLGPSDSVVLQRRVSHSNFSPSPANTDSSNSLLPDSISSPYDSAAMRKRPTAHG